MKTPLFIFCVLFVSVIACAQNPVYVKYYNTGGLEVANKDSASYLRYYYKDTTQNANSYLIKEYYQTGKIKTIGSLYVVNGRERFNRTFNHYDENGVLRETVSYKDGYKLGASYSFYPNRKLKKEVIYDFNTQHDISLQIMEQQGINHDSMMAKGRLMEYVDTLGNKIITRGNGFFKEDVSYFGEQVLEEGNYVNGFKHGEWKLTTKDEAKVYIEKYKNGTFVEGDLHAYGKKHKYEKIVQQPNYQLFSANNTGLYGPALAVKLRISFQDYLREIGFKYADTWTENIEKVMVSYNVIIDERGKYVDLEMITLLPDGVVSALKKEYQKIGFFSKGYYRGQAKQMKYPSRLILSYPKDLQ